MERNTLVSRRGRRRRTRRVVRALVQSRARAPTYRVVRGRMGPNRGGRNGRRRVVGRVVMVVIEGAVEGADRGGRNVVMRGPIEGCGGHRARVVVMGRRLLGGRMSAGQMMRAVVSVGLRVVSVHCLVVGLVGVIRVVVLRLLLCNPLGSHHLARIVDGYARMMAGSRHVMLIGLANVVRMVVHVQGVNR